jgi:hypothetical protein
MANGEWLTADGWSMPPSAIAISHEPSAILPPASRSVWRAAVGSRLRRRAGALMSAALAVAVGILRRRRLLRCRLLWRGLTRYRSRRGLLRRRRLRLRLGRL